MRIALAQINPLVGDILANTQLILNSLETAASQFQPDIVVFPELAICGYPPEDLLLRDDLYVMIDNALEKIQEACQSVAAVVGYPARYDGKTYNAVAFIHNGVVKQRYFKQKLPNYSVFDEMRYFSPGQQTCVFDFKGTQVGLLICEDLWFKEPIAKAKEAGAELILSPNASPYHFGHNQTRVEQMQSIAKDNDVALVYVNLIGGQDELVFDGRSLVFDNHGDICCELGAFESQLSCVDWTQEQWRVIDNNTQLPASFDEEIYQALILGVRDYVQKNKFPGVIIGLSGGIDSALTLAIAVDALGKDKVQAVMMPFKYTAQMSIQDAQEEAEALGVAFDIISIEPIYESFMLALDGQFANTQVDTTEQNLQARCRGTLLMAISNKSGRMVLTTGNKSEVAVGYATLYGDMAGGFDVLKDLPKEMVYQLSRYRNSLSKVIPERVISRAPSAELAPDQKDDDSLPPYPILDAILDAYVVDDYSVSEIVKLGYDEETVRFVMRLVDRNEYKRRQAAPGVRLSKRAFGRDRRYPITSGFSRQL